MMLTNEQAIKLFDTSSDLFWKRVLFANFKRSSDKKRWLFAKLIESAIDLSGITDVDLLFEFIDSSDGQESLDWTKNSPDLRSGTKVDSKCCGRCESGWYINNGMATP